LRNIDRLSLFKRDKAQTKREGIGREREREGKRGEKERREGKERKALEELWGGWMIL